MIVTPPWLDIAERDLLDGVKEIKGGASHHRIEAAHARTIGEGTADEVHWCASMVSLWLHEAGVTDPKTARARRFLRWGTALDPFAALPDIWTGSTPYPVDKCPIPFGAVIVMARGASRPGPDVLDATGHVCLFYGWDQPGFFLAIGGNQGNRVQVSTYASRDIIGVRWP